MHKSHRFTTVPVGFHLLWLAGALPLINCSPGTIRGYPVGDKTPPVCDVGQPSGVLMAGTQSTLLSLQTNEPATCRWGDSSTVAYKAMSQTFEGAQTTHHVAAVDGLLDGNSYTYYVRCQDAAGNTPTSSYEITFAVGGPDTSPPVVSSGQPSGILSPGTLSVAMSVQTNEAATCRYSDSPSATYADMQDTFAGTGGTHHTVVVRSLADGGSYNYYVHCQDAAGNTTTAGYAIHFSVAEVGVGSECSDGIDNDGDGLTDWTGGDMACTSPNGSSEAANADDDMVIHGVQNRGWTVVEPLANSVLCFADSVSGSASGDGSVGSPKATFSQCATMISGNTSDNAPDFIFLFRGGSYGGHGSLPSGASEAAPVVVAAYGPANAARPIVSNIPSANHFMLYAGLQLISSVSLTLPEYVWVEGCMVDGADYDTYYTWFGHHVRFAWNISANGGHGYFLAGTRFAYLQYALIVDPTSNGFSHGAYITKSPHPPQDVLNEMGVPEIEVQVRETDTRWNLMYESGDTPGDGIKQRPGGTAQGNVMYNFSLNATIIAQCDDDGAGGTSCQNSACGVCLPVGLVEDNVAIAGGSVANMGAGYFAQDAVVGSRNHIASDGAIRVSDLGSATDTNTVDLGSSIDGSRPTLDLLELYMTDVLGHVSANDNAVMFFEEARDFYYDYRNINPLYTAECLRRFAELVRDQEQGMDGYSASDASLFGSGDYTCNGVGEDTDDGNGAYWLTY